jgi:hypothetical protein
MNNELEWIEVEVPQAMDKTQHKTGILDHHCHEPLDDIIKSHNAR